MEGPSETGKGAVGGDTPTFDDDFQRKLFEIPSNLEFPLELNVDLKGKLHSVLEQNWHLKRHLDYLDAEVIELRKYRAEHRDKCGRSAEPDYTTSSASMMTQRIVELSKKNRDLTAQTEGMKTKINKLIRENDSLRNMVECFRDKDSQDDLMARNSYHHPDFDVNSTTPGSQHNVQLTNKVIEYRRQNQLLRMELKTALRALSQEVGDGATPHGVINTVAGPTWRGRQQQIIALQQKVSELQLKLKEASSSNNNISVDHESAINLNGPNNGGGDADSNSVVVAAAEQLNIPQRAVLIQQERKKQEQIEKLTHDLEQCTKDLKTSQHELRASKARIQTLESHVKNFKSHIEILEGKLIDGEKAAEGQAKEMKQLRQEIANHKERERRFRDQTAIEIQEGQRALQRERAIVMRLQNVIQEKQDTIQKLDAEIIELRNKLELSCSGQFSGGMQTLDKMREMETQLKNSAKALEAAERERQSLVKMMQDYLNQVEEERGKCVKASEHTARISSVLQRAEQCINECLDAGRVTNEEVLQEVEHIRALIRELKLGDLYVYENVAHKDSAKKLKSQVEMLKREIASLKTNLKEVSAARRKDLQNFASVTERLKSDWAEAVSIKKTAAGGLTIPIPSNKTKE